MKKVCKSLLPLVLIISIVGCDNRDAGEITDTMVDRLYTSPTAKGRAEYDYLKFHDPNTNTLPQDRLIDAVRIRDRLLKSRGRSSLQFEERGPSNVSGRTRAILVDKRDPSGNTIWAGGVSGGLWKSTDKGKNWIQINDFFDYLTIGAIAQDPVFPEIMYFGTGEGHQATGGLGQGVWKSIDGGESFTQVTSTANSSDWRIVDDIVITDNGTVITANESIFCNRGGVFVTITGGVIWGRLADEDNCSTVDGTFNFATDLEYASDGSVYACFGMIGDNDGIYKSGDQGLSWDKIYTSASDESRLELAVAPSNPNVLYLLIDDWDIGDPPKIKKSTDGGLNWSELPQPKFYDGSNCSSTKTDWGKGQAWYNLIAAVDPNDENTVMIGAIDLFRTQDGGTSWQQISSWTGDCYPYVHADQHEIEYVDSDMVYIGNDGGIFLTENASATQPDFEFISHGYNVTQFYSCDFHPDATSEVIIGGSQDNGTQLFMEPGVNETTTVSGGDGGFSHIDQENPELQIASQVYNDYYITKDHWMTSERIVFDLDEGMFINPTDFDDTGKVLYAAYRPQSFIRWEVGSGRKIYDVVNVDDFPEDIQNSAVHISPNISDRVYFGFANGEVYRIDNANTDTNKSAVKIFGETDGTVSCIVVEEGNEDHVMVILSNYGITNIYESRNASDDNPLWLAIEGNLPDMPIHWGIFDPTDPDKAVIATELGVWSTSLLNGNNTTWEPENVGLANVRCTMIKVRPSDNRVFVATHGRGMFTSDSYFPLADEDNDGYPTDVDCDDTNANINPGAEEIINNDMDEDCDGIAQIVDEDEDGYHSDEDCDDTNPDINPGKVEIANNDVDENCDGIALVIDDDNDGYNSSEDCDDTNANINPGAEEIPNNGIDENCDGLDEVIDADEDGYNSNEDCDDNNPNINPGKVEIANNDVDENCDGIALVIDDDNDGYNSSEDCDDSNVNINPEAEEIPNNDVDENCDGIALVIDEDNDGYHSDEDCDDSNANINPEAEEIPNNDVDEDCNGIALIIDNDNDGYHSDEDCDDTNANINPGAEEIPDNQIDENCDGSDATSGSYELSGVVVDIFPNPATSFLKIKTELHRYHFTVFDLQGRIVVSGSAQSGDTSIECSDWKVGIYLLKISNEEGKAIIDRIIKE